MSSNKSITKRYDTRYSRKTKNDTKKILENKHFANELKESQKSKAIKESSNGNGVASETKARLTKKNTKGNSS